ncbi:MAG: class I SAM-dependent methyltransferase [Elusimicrobia bacterium]|nr:class I SAM-dependent methyltransferase [Elusimicrobiota bacterium]
MSDIALRHENERLQKEALEKLFKATDLPVFDMFRNFPVFTPRYNLARFLVHYELFKKVCALPGVIIDLGVFQGASTFTWAKLSEIFCPTDVRKVVYGFDTFAGFPSLAAGDEGVDSKNDRKVGGFFPGATIERDLRLAQEAMRPDKHIRHIDRIEFVKGDAAQSIPEFVKAKGSGFKIALLNVDFDLYEPTKVALEHFVPHMVRGGIIIADEYALETFAGETKAIDEYFQKNFGSRPKVQKFSWHSVPSAYIEVDW